MHQAGIRPIAPAKTRVVHAERCGDDRQGLFTPPELGFPMGPSSHYAGP